MCCRFAQMERKLGEIDRARAIYAHASQFCDPRTSKEFWKEWNQFEIDTGSEDTFREMLRIRRGVQASFNTDDSYVAASARLAEAGEKTESPNIQEAADPMAAVEREATGGVGGAPAFVASTLKPLKESVDVEVETADANANPDAIDIADDEF